MFGPLGGKNSAHGVHQVKARAGHHLAPVPLSNGQLTFDALGQGFTLIALDADEVQVKAFADAAQALKIPFDILRDTRTDGREAYEAALVLVRPDQYVVWSGEALDRPAADLLRHCVGLD
jgi:hypothetical protein